MTAVYRHQNGGGLKVYPAQASPDSYLHKRSTLEGETNVYASSLTLSALRDTFAAASTVHAAALADSRLSDAYVENSDVVSSEIVASEVVDCRLTRCRVFANEGMKPVVYGVKLAGVTVFGGATLYGPWGLELEGAHIHDGVWREAPRHLLIEGGGLHVAVVECTEGRAHMGCTCRPVKHWLDRGPKLGRRLGWTGEQIEACRTFLLSL